MRRAIATTAFLALSSTVFAQSNAAYTNQGATPYPSSTSTSAYPPGSATSGYQQSDTQPVGAPASQEPDPDNCGTPDEPKACPPMPRRSMNHYRSNQD